MRDNEILYYGFCFGESRDRGCILHNILCVHARWNIQKPDTINSFDLSGRIFDKSYWFQEGNAQKENREDKTREPNDSEIFTRNIIDGFLFLEEILFVPKKHHPESYEEKEGSEDDVNEIEREEVHILDAIRYYLSDSVRILKKIQE